MSSAHILERQGTTWHVVVHTPVPSGNNVAGVSWKTAFLNSGRSGLTTMTEGSGPGQITTVEKATVLTGDVLELHLQVEVETGVNPTATLNELVPRMITDTLNEWRQDLRYFGMTRA